MFDYHLRFANKEDNDRFLSQYSDKEKYCIIEIGKMGDVFGYFSNLRSREELFIPSSLLVHPNTPSYNFY